MIRIWFNHWFSTAYHLIRLMGEGGEGRFQFIGSSANPDALYKLACDAFFSEPQGLSEEDYVRWCLAFCEEHGVQVFVPRKNLAAVVEHADDFATRGVSLFAERDAALVRTMEDKLATYELMRTVAPERVPDVAAVYNIEEFEAEYRRLSTRYPRLCYKLSVDEGAQSFRVIAGGNELNSLYARPGSKVTLDTALCSLSSYSFAVPVLLMPYLDGVEVSVDCLATADGTIAIPRYKVGSRYSELRFDRKLMDECSLIVERLGFRLPVNIQFRTGADALYLLEINPRMSGGLQLSCVASGINIPSIALRALLGEKSPWHYPAFSTRKVAHLETPVCLS